MGWSVRHKRLAIGGWLALVLLAIAISALIPGDQKHSTDPGESGRAEQVLRGQSQYAPDREAVLVQPAGPVLDDLATALRATGQVLDVQTRTSGSNGLLTFTYASTSYDVLRAAVDATAAKHPEARVAEAGDTSLARAVDDGIQADFKRSEFISLPLTAVILLVVFGSLIAAGIPLLLALSTVAGTFGLLQVIAHVVPINSATSSMVLLIGVAVSVDYSLFYLRRVREERAAGRDTATALAITGRTSGRAVLVSGLIVMLCLCGLLVTGLDNFRGLTVGAVLVVGLALAGSVTVLPALLALAGDRITRGWRVAAGRSRLWEGVAARVVRRPLLWGGLAAVLLLLVAAPALGLRLQDAAVTDSLPRSVPAVDAALRIQRVFPGEASPERLVVWNADGSDVDSPAVRAAIGRLGPVTVSPVDRVIVVRVPLPGSGTDPVSDAALEHLRNQVLPATLGQVGGVHYAVEGRTSFAYDFTGVVRDRMPIVFAVVLVLAFVLLAVAFRAPALALVSIGLNLLSIGAAYGVLTWVFQDGHLGARAYGGIVDWLPLFIFVILFGLSMDYHVFILSRVRERGSVLDGIATSAGVVTSAAVIMTAVFSVFVTLRAIEYQMLGVGMAVAVVIDATVVRGVLLPAALTVLQRLSRTKAALRPAP